MCLIFAAYRVHEAYPLILLSNRDEFRHRPTASMHFWEDSPILAGRDLQDGGTWMGLHRNGRLAAVTNYRDPFHIKKEAPSRGQIPVQFLLSELSSEKYLQSDIPWKTYNGFNAFFWDMEQLYWLSNYAEAPQMLTPGIYGLSNALLDTPWPKVIEGKKQFTHWLANIEPNIDAALQFMGDSKEFSENLPNTGVGAAMEKMLSPLCITSPAYGTRCTTLIMYHKNGNISAVEYNRDQDEKLVFALGVAPETASFTA